VTCWASCSNSARALRRVVCAALCGFAAAAAAQAPVAASGVRGGPAVTQRPPLRRLAVFPLVNASGVVAPMRDIGAALRRQLEKERIPFVEGAPVDDFLARHRIRYTGGLDAATAVLASRELGVDQVLITTVVAVGREPMPRLSVEARLVTAADDPRIVWADGFSRLGDESPGAFDLGVIRDFDELAARGFAGLARSLSAFAQQKEAAPAVCPPAGRFRPRSSYRSAALDFSAPRTIAVLPFQNLTRRRNAGDVISLAFVRQFQSLSSVSVTEPGVLRDDLLRFRVVLQGGISLDVARMTMELVHADLALTGVVRSFDDALSADGVPRLEYTVMLLDRRGDEVVWRSTSYSQGDDGVFFFDAGKVSTVGDLACRMAQSTVRAMLEQRPTPGRKIPR
jgi:TolB-like protein